jgi:integrase
MAKRRRVREWSWGDGRIYRKTRTKADGTTYTEPRWWLQFSVDGVVRREPSGTDDAGDAQKILDKKVAALRAGAPPPPTRSIRLSDLERRFFDDYAARKRRSVSTARGRWKNLAAHFDMDRRALGITIDELSAYGLKRVKDGASDSTVNREWAALKHAFRLALHAKVITYMPSFPENLKEPEARDNFITPSQSAAIRAYLVEHDRAAEADALGLSMILAWRKGQVLKLEWAHISEDEIRVPGAITKNERKHAVPIVPAIAEIIERRRAARVLGSPWVFARKDGKRIQDFEKVWASACEAAGCAGTRYHDSRRSGLRALIDAKVPEKVAMEIGGWKTRSVLDRYHIVRQDDMRKALEAVSAPAPEKVAPKKHHRRVVAIGSRGK